MKPSLLIAFILFCLPFTAFAVKLSPIYHAEILVVSQTNDAREQAVKDGLLQVLIRISGNPDIDKNPAIRAALRKAEYFVQEYSYLPDSRDSSQYQLKINYEPNDVKRLLQKAKVGSGENHPLILVWLNVIDNQHNFDVISNETKGTVFDKMTQEGNKYGLPVIFPMMDVDDINLVSSDDISAMNIPVLQEAAKRYRPQGLLIGEIEENDNACQTHWKLLMKDNQWDWKIENKTMDNVITIVMNQVSKVISGDGTAKGSH